MDIFDKNGYKEDFQDVEFETVEIDPDVEEKIEEIKLVQKRQRWNQRTAGNPKEKTFFSYLWTIAKIAIFIFVVLPILISILGFTVQFLFFAIPIFILAVFFMRLFNR
ncbi:MAG TPA: hypothetical protein VJ990_00340 [Clostridia bacterium]|nr:hypothetical protein [Clostridia bacterium]